MPMTDWNRLLTVGDRPLTVGKNHSEIRASHVPAEGSAECLSEGSYNQMM